MRVSMRPEWPALLHNLCMLHSLVRLRTRFGLTGWNKPMDLRNIGTAELWVSITDHLCGRFRLFTEADLIIWRKQFFSAARVGSGCTRVSRQCRYGMARGWINEAYPVEWITVYVNRGTPSPPNNPLPPPHVTWENEWTLFVWAKFNSKPKLNLTTIWMVSLTRSCNILQLSFCTLYLLTDGTAFCCANSEFYSLRFS